MATKPRFWIIMGIIVFAAIIAIAVAASGNSSPAAGPSATMPPEYTVCSCTLYSDMGLRSVIVTNYNTYSLTTVTRTEIPFSFNFTRNSVLSFRVTAEDGFVFDAWFSNDGYFHNQNPYTIKAQGSFTMTASFTPLEVPTL